jgi:type II secretory pathway predicted ATPase ExeA
MTETQGKTFDSITGKWDRNEQVLAFITGGAGVGKSRLVKELFKAAKEREMVPEVAATTGIAAKNIGGVTLHSFLKMDWNYRCRVEHGTTDAYRLAQTHVVFVDECSMLAGEALEALNRLLKEFSEPHNGGFFGGELKIYRLNPIGQVLQSLFSR